jgi:hypothetical protein
MDRSTKIGRLVLSLFALPFVLGGLAAIKQAIRTAQDGPNNSSAWPLVLFGLVFTGIGVGLIYAAFYGAKRLQHQQQLQAARPAEPWLWRDDWAQGRVQSRTRNDAIGGWIFAIFWNVVSIPVTFLVFSQASKQKGSLLYVFLLFPAVGTFLLVRAIRQTIAFYEFGKTYFQMSSVPGVVGLELKGSIQARFPHSPDHGIHLQLTSAHRVTSGSGKSQNTTETVLWRDEADLSSGQLYPGPDGTTIPVSFRIPQDAQPTEKRNFRDEFVWLLEASADVPGVNYHDVFEVPVFRTAQTPTEATVFAAAEQTPAQRPRTMTVEVRANANGTEFYFPAGRNKSFAMSTTFFLLIFGSISIVLFRVPAPIIFPIAFGFFSLLLLYFTVQLWLGTTRVVIGDSAITLQSGLLGGGSVQRIPLSDVASIGDKIKAQQGGSTGTPYYDIELSLLSGKRLTLGHTLRDKHETEWLVGEMRRLANLQSKSMTASANR